jgi:hypothetical protein
MIECVRDDQGRILAVCEWLLFRDGVFREDGNMLLVGDIEINPDKRGNGIIRKFIRVLYEKNPQAEWLFFYRNYKYPGRPGKLYTREQIKKLLGG